MDKRLRRTLGHMTNAETIEEAKRIAESIMLAQIGDVNAMAAEATVQAITQRLLKDGGLLYATIRTLSGTAVAFATRIAATSTERGTAEWEAKSAELLRGVVERLAWTVNE